MAPYRYHNGTIPVPQGCPHGALAVPNWYHLQEVSAESSTALSTFHFPLSTFNFPLSTTSTRSFEMILAARFPRPRLLLMVRSSGCNCDESVRYNPSNGVLI